MKRYIAALLAALAALFALPACAGGGGQESEKLQVVATIFPVYDWARELLGEAPHAELTLLLGSGVDMHSYQPTAGDLIRISACDVFIYVGGESDKWVEDALKNAKNKDIIAINLLETLGDAAKDEGAAEGMESGHEGHGGEADEHIWLSLKNAQALCPAIASKLAEADPENREAYEANLARYGEKLAALDREYDAAVSASKKKTLLFGDRFPFLYLTEDYGLSYYAAFPGCSSETEASFETISFLSKKADELGLGVVLTIEGTKHRIAETVISETKGKNLRILTLDSIQSVSKKDADRGVTYLSTMEKNLVVLKEALE